MAKKLKVGVIGLGAIGPVHADAYTANAKEVELAAVCDILPDRLQTHGDKFNVKNRFTDYRQLLKSDVDAVSVCVGNTLHREIAVAAFKAGKHVLVEKPMAMNAQDAQAIVDAGKRSGKVLQVGMVYRQAAETKLVRKYVEDGVLGEVYHVRTVLIRRRGIPGLGGWFTTKAQSGGGPLIDIGVHWFDISMFMSGLWKPTSVSAMTYDKFGRDMKAYRYVSMWAGPPDFNGVFDVEDYAAGFARFGKKASMSFEIAWAANSPEDAYVEILGSKGGIRVLDGKPFRLLTEVNGNVADVTPQYPEVNNRFHAQARAFAAACRGDAPPAATGEQGVVNMKLIDAVYASAKAGKEIQIHA